MTVHHLKSYERLFTEMLAGRKMHDLRRSHDRDFNVGDSVVLHEVIDDGDKFGGYTGRTLEAEITYITDTANHCALSPGALDPHHSILSYRYKA